MRRQSVDSLGVRMRLLVATILLVAMEGVHADSAWQTHREGTGTPFESRWANSEPLPDESSDGTMVGSAGINASDGDLNLYVVHPIPMVDALIAALGEEELKCTFKGWRLAVDRQEFVIASTSESTDNSATFLQPQNDQAFWNAFEAGSLLAIQVERSCNGDMDVATLVYSLSGSEAAVDFVLNKVPLTSQSRTDEERHVETRYSTEMADYQFAIAQQIRRNWSVPASAGSDIRCTVQVTQIPGGEVVGVHVTSCNGDDAVVRSVEAAVRRSSPLPLPSNPDLFDRNLTVNLTLDREN